MTVEVTEKDLIYYSRIIDLLGNVLDVFDSFCKNDGLERVPNEEIMELLITSFKKWLLTDDGADWLSDLGYFRKDMNDSFVQVDRLTTCQVCSSTVNLIESFKCEACGKIIRKLCQKNPILMQLGFCMLKAIYKNNKWKSGNLIQQP